MVYNITINIIILYSNIVFYLYANIPIQYIYKVKQILINNNLIKYIHIMGMIFIDNIYI